MIRFYSNSIPFVLKSKRLIRAWLESLLENEHKLSGNINYVFCSDAYILDMNIQFLSHSFYTDVISFEYSETGDNFVNGDIYISIDTVKANSKTYKTSFYHELHRVMAHGLLHFCSYDDKTPEQQIIMRKREDFYLARLLGE